MGKFLKRLRAIRSNVNEIRTAATTFDSSTELVGFAQLKQVWSILKPAANLVKILTPEKADAIIDKVILMGDKVANGEGESEFTAEFAKVWGFIRTALFVAMQFTNDKADGVIEEIIEWGDYVAKDDL